MVYLTTQQFDCPTTLQQTKPPNALGYKCMVASKTNFNSDFLFNVPRFQYYLQNAQTQMLPSAIQSRQPNCPNIVQASSDAIQISIDYSFSSQYLESVYVSFDLIYQGSADSFQIISQWNKVYFKGVYQKSDFPSITNDGCGYNLSKFVVKMNMPSDVLNANAVAISFQLFNGNNYRTVSISDFEILFYYKCPVGCAQSCANGQCSDCLSGYSLVSGQCVLQCTQGLFLKIDPNSTQQSCVSCIQNCDKCSDANSCDTCKSGFVYMKINNANQCVALCTQPAQYIDSQGVCQNCIQNCDKCSDANSCDTCKSGFVYMKINNANQCVAQCTQPAQYIDSQGVCQNCVQNCTSCSQANTCDTCAPQFVKNQQGTCDCLGYISNSQCLPCYSSCQTCSDGQKTSCKSCQNGYYPVLNPLSQTLFECLQACPNNYLFVNNQCKQCDTTNYKSCFNCPSTCRTCSSSQSTVCIDCFDGMQLNQNGKCSSLSDQRNLDFYFRSYNDIAVVSAVFSSQTPTLTFEFGLNIISPSVQCNQIFDDSTLGLLKASTCSISTSKIIVSLSQDATIMVTSTINIINTAQILKFVNQQPINNIYLLSVVQEPVSGQVILQYDQVTSYCNDVTFQIKAINNDAGRGFLNFQWVLDQIQNYDQSTIQNLNIIIQAANSQQQQTLVIPKQIFPPDINIAIILTYTFKTNFKGQTSASTFVQSVKQISVSAIQNLYPPVYRYVDLQVKFLFFTQECGKSGTNAVQDIYDIQITSQLLPSLNKHFPQYKSQVLNFDIPPYSVLTANANLDIQLQISIAKNQALSTTYSMSIPYSLSNLQLFIQNGVEQLVDYKRDLNMIGVVRDFEVLDPNAPQGIQLKWSCKVIGSRNGDSSCYTYKNTLYDIPQNIQSFTIDGGTFNPYQILQFNFAGSKDTRSAQQDILIIFAEIDLPPLYVKFDDPAQIQSVNINDDISATLVYNSKINSDILTYAGAILYNNFVVGVIKFDYQKVKFRIWDYFSDLIATNPLIQVRFTVYNPENIMPSLSVTNFKVNIPPQNCKLSITPSTGQALTTLFSIQMTQCTTINTPLTYQFFYYNHDTDIKQEILVPQKILRRQLQDQTLMQSVTTSLPSGKLVIMAQAMDSYLAIYNTTLQVEVTPFQQNEQTLLSLLDKALSLQSSNLGVSDIVKKLCVISEEISQNTTLYNLDSVNQKKILLIQALINQTNLLPSSSFLSTFSNKIVANLQASLAPTSSLQSQNVLDQVSLILQSQQQQIMNNNKNNNKLLNNNDIVLQNLVDSFKIVNSTTQSISQILQQLSNGNDKRILNDINQGDKNQFSTDSLRALAASVPQNLLQQQINMTDQIGNLLNNITLPNQGQLNLQGNLISIKTEQITAKNLQKYLYIQNEPQQSDQNIYNVVLTNYTSNPYIQTDGFLQYTNQLQNQTPGIQVSLNPVVKPFIQSINNGSNTTFDNSFQLQFSNIKPSKYNLTCLQQQSSQKWINSQCKMVNSSTSGRYTCICKDQLPTTIIEDFQVIFNNKNLETAFGSQGIQNISNFTTFYEYAIFWILSSVTLLQVGLCWYGKQLDSKQGVISSSTVAPVSLAHIGQLEQIVSQEKQMSPIKRKKRSILQNKKQQQLNAQQDQIHQNDQNAQSYRWLQLNILQSGAQTNIQVTQISNQQSQDSQQQKNKIQEQENANSNENQSILSLCQKQKEEKDIQQINKQVKIDQESQAMKPSSIEIQSQQISENEINIVNMLKESKNTKKLQEASVFKKILIFHSFSSIFFVYSNEQSRAFRFSLFYLRVIHSLSISIIFDQQYNQEQILIISGINSVVIIVSAAIIQLIYKKRKIGQVIASFIMLSLLSLYYYVILSIISGQSESYSNRKVSSFFIMFGVDFLFFSTIISMFSIYIFNYIACGGSSNGVIIRLLNLLQIQYILENIKL